MNAVNFPDEVFRSYIQKEYGDTITTSQIAEITSLNVNGKGIYSLTGIEHFTALEILRCDNNHLTTLDVSKNIGLTDLECHNNQLKTLDLSNNTILYALYCDNNQFQPFSLSRLTNIRQLECNFTITQSENMYYLKLDGSEKCMGREI